MGAKESQDGQSTFEFLIYLPFLLLFVNIFVSVSGAINASINQEKVTRGYFFYIAKGNPNLPKRSDVLDKDGLSGNEIANASMFSIGWREKDVGTNSFLTCFKIKPFTSTDLAESCEKSAADQNKTYLVRIGTLFGVCAATYTRQSDNYFLNVGAPGSCSLGK
jgi:hypothetical protein